MIPPAGEAATLPEQHPSMPPEATAVFAGRAHVAERYAAILADTGVSHGLIGPREVPRLWERHILNCAVVQDAFPPGSTVIDVGSGAGLPGLPLAIARADLQLHLVEPMLRRAAWLSATVESLRLKNVIVHRARAEDLHGVLSAPFVTARAVARVDRLARWCFPLLGTGGVLVALKGSSAQEELDTERDLLVRMGMSEGRVTTHGAGVVRAPTLAMQLKVSAPAARAKRPAHGNAPGKAPGKAHGKAHAKARPGRPGQ